MRVRAVRPLASRTSTRLIAVGGNTPKDHPSASAETPPRPTIAGLIEAAFSRYECHQRVSAKPSWRCADSQRTVPDARKLAGFSQSPSRRSQFSMAPVPRAWSRAARGPRLAQWTEVGVRGSQPVSRVLSGTAIHLGRASPHASSDLPGSSAGHASPYARKAPDSFPIWSCSRWGLPCHHCYQRRGALLPHHFTLTHGREAVGGIFSVALSVGSRPPGVTWHLALWSPDFPPRTAKVRSDCPAGSRAGDILRPTGGAINAYRHRCRRRRRRCPHAASTRRRTRRCGLLR